MCKSRSRILIKSDPCRGRRILRKHVLQVYFCLIRIRDELRLLLAALLLFKDVEVVAGQIRF